MFPNESSCLRGVMSHLNRGKDIVYITYLLFIFFCVTSLLVFRMVFIVLGRRAVSC